MRLTPSFCAQRSAVAEPMPGFVSNANGMSGNGSCDFAQDDGKTGAQDGGRTGAQDGGRTRAQDGGRTGAQDNGKVGVQDGTRVEEQDNKETLQ